VTAYVHHDSGREDGFMPALQAGCAGVHRGYRVERNLADGHSPANRNRSLEICSGQGAAVKMTSAKSHSFSLFWDCGGLVMSAHGPSAIDRTIEGLSCPPIQSIGINVLGRLFLKEVRQ
jgi:hypothetical protein